MSPTKRKAAAVAPGGDTPDSKRRRGLDGAPQETPQTVQEAGSALLTQLRDARDKRNRSIVTHFEKLPDKNVFPDYYEQIALPLSLEILQGKLNRLEYSSLSELESDIKRLISNAKSYNDRGSEIHSDAEKVRKMVATSMQKINPAYGDPSYAPLPTPIPDDEAANEVDEAPREDEKPDEVDEEELAEEEAEDVKKGGRQRLFLRGPSEKSLATSEPQSDTPVETQPKIRDVNFEGKTFQTAQDAIVRAMIDYEDEDGLAIANPFMTLPPRDLKEYYQVIKHPVSLKAVQKQVRGIRGREKPLGISFFKYWQSFEEEIGFIWKNARTFNEDESEIVQYANQLEQYFSELITKAKHAVPGPAPPHIKLHLGSKEQSEPSPKIKLSFTSKPAAGSANGISVDPEALKRQNEMVRAGINGTMATPTNDTSPKRPTAGSPTRSSELVRSRSGGPIASSADGATPATAASPVDTAMRDRSDDSAPVAAADQRAASASIPPLAARLPPPHASSPQPPSHLGRQQLPPDQFQSRRREPGKGVESALIQDAVLYSPASTPGGPFPKLRVLPNAHRTHNGLHAYLDPRQTRFILDVRDAVADPLRFHKWSVLVNDKPVQLSQQAVPGVQTMGTLCEFNLVASPLMTNRVHVLLSSTVSRGPGMGTVEDRELRWFHLDYWP